ncbi:glycosyltransferase [Acidisoma sp. L85]|uniref:glycosyltransferase n=1 Tax=Acidisoma sp. L85 TaxID=1641850 RepID=UPI00131DF553|nr:glycosyltransferase [Acidisoma sp. L85]
MGERVLPRIGRPSRDAAAEQAAALLRVERDYLRAKLAELTADDGVVAHQDAQLRAQRAEEMRLTALLAESESRRQALEVKLAETTSQAADFQSQLAEQTVLQRDLEQARSEASFATDEVLAIRRVRNALLASASWRITAPLRAITSRLPAGFGRFLRRMAKLSYWLMTPHRIPRRLAALQSRRRERGLSFPLSPVAAAVPQTENSAPAPPAFYLFAGEFIPLEAALDFDLHDGGSVTEFVAAAATRAAIVVEPSVPIAEDHVLFTGVVWEQNASLFRVLASKGVQVSILLHDLVPIERPDSVPSTQRDAFLDDLRMVLSLASHIFVPNTTIQDELQKFVILSGWSVAGEIILLPSGSTPMPGVYDSIRTALLLDRSEDPTFRPLARRIFEDQRPVALMTAFAHARLWCTETDPEVSIIIVNWHAGPRTVECIRSIWANTEGVSYEILIVDNGSGNGDVALLRCLGVGVRILDLGCNRFFGEANNIAAEQASGRLLCLLHNDAVVQSGWLRALRNTLLDAPDAGVVGPLFLNADDSIREAGRMIDIFGYPVRLGRGRASNTAAFLAPRMVDTISAATMLMPRVLYLQAGGFDLAYEPARYEDVDLCLKILALRRQTLYCPEARVIHNEGVEISSEAEARQMALDDLSHTKFVSRWGSYLASRSTADLWRIAKTIIQPDIAPRPAVDTGRSRKEAVLYTPYLLTPGGGERYLLSFAAALSASADVAIVTPHPYSYLRLDNLGREFDIDLSQCRLETLDDFLRKPAPSFMLTMGNHILPPIDARAPNSIYLCQFPFAIPPHDVAQGSLDGYSSIIAYSDYAKTHITAALSANCLAPLPVEVLYPPVPFIGSSANDPERRKQRNMILSVGRFFVGGHSKRQDLLITAFRAVVEALPKEDRPELHLAGSSMPTAEDIDYLATLRRLANGLPVFFYVNVAPDDLIGLYQKAEIYWHGTGLGADLEQEPEKAEHFGISLVEAMSAACVVFAYGSGGPCEIITDGVDGFLYSSIEILAKRTQQLIAESECSREAIGRAAGRRAADFSTSRFNSHVRRLADASAP